MSKKVLLCLLACLMLLFACSRKVEVDYDLLADKVIERLLSKELGVLVTNPSNGHRYGLVNIQMTWHEAKEYADRLGGHLAIITSVEEQDWVCQKFPYIRCWLGGTDENVEGEWKWVTGEKWDYTNWGPGEPNNLNSRGGENALEMHLSPDNPFGLWNDLTAEAIFPTSLLVEFEEN